MKDNDVRQAVLEVEELKLKAQLRAVREAIKGEDQPLPEDGQKRKSQVEYVYDILTNVSHLCNPLSDNKIANNRT